MTLYDTTRFCKLKLSPETLCCESKANKVLEQESFHIHFVPLPPYPLPSPHQAPWPRVKGHHHHTKSDLSLDSNVTPLKQHINAARAGLAQTVIEMAGGGEVCHSASPPPLHPSIRCSQPLIHQCACVCPGPRAALAVLRG